MNKDYLDSLSKDQLENRIYDLENELNQEFHLHRIMAIKNRYEAAKRSCLLQGPT